MTSTQRNNFITAIYLIVAIMLLTTMGVVMVQDAGSDDCTPVVTPAAQVDYSNHTWSAEGHVIGYSTEEDSVIWNERGCIVN